MVAAGFLTWWQAGGESVEGVPIPASAGIGLEGPGIVVYGAALAALVLLDIGYMRGRWGFVLDGPWVYLALGLVAAGGARLPDLGAVVGGLPAAAAAIAGAGGGRGRGSAWSCTGRGAGSGLGARSSGRAGSSSGLIRIQPTMTASSRPPRISIGRRSGR